MLGMNQVLILGAGLSGLTAARALQEAGREVVVVDKGRGVGGRLATRRAFGGTFDHGAQFFTARSDEFQTLLRQWQQSGVASEWFAAYPSPTNEKPGDHHPRFRGQSGMTGIAKHLARDLEVQLDTEIERLERHDGRWHAFSKGGYRLESDQLLLTAPVLQSLALLSRSEIELPAAARQTLEALRYEPCFAVMAQLEGPSQIPPPGALYLNQDVLWWIADNFQKGISPREGSVTIHSSGPWAQQHYERDQREVGAALIEAAAAYLGGPVAGFEVRRWRYSKPENPLEIGALRVNELNLGFAGDIFQGAKVEGAALSGLAAARQMLGA